MEKRRFNGFNWHDAAYWGIIVLACAAFLVMNVLTTLKEDDLAYSLIEGVWTPIGSLMDVFRSHAAHYVGSNGRVADWFAVLFSGLLGKGVFNVCNTLVFGLLLHLLSLLTTGRRSLLAVSLFLAVVGTCFPVPGETMLWLAGACNYLWAITTSLALARVLQRRQGRPLGWCEGLLTLLGAMVAGAFNEATSFGFLAGWCLYYACNRRLFDRRVAVALVGYAVGVAIIVASPGAWQRAADGGIVVDMGLADLLSSRWHIFAEKMWRFYLPAGALAVGVLMLVMGKARLVARSVWTYVFVCMALVMFALGIIHERAYAPMATVAFMILTMVADALLSRCRLGWPRAALVAVSLALAVFSFARGIKVLDDYKAYDDRTMAEIAASAEQAVLREREFDGYSRFVKPMNFNSSHFFAHELVYRAYFGKKNVQFVTDSVYVRYHEGRLLDGANMQLLNSDPAGMVGPVYTFPDQDYAAILLQSSTLPCSFQTARFYRFSSSDESNDPDELARRRQYGLPTDYDPHGFYPLVYQGQCYLITDAPESLDIRMVFPLALPPDPQELTVGGI